MFPSGPGTRIIANVAIFQAAWFACVASAAQGTPAWGLAAVAAAVAIHLAMSSAPGRDALLILAALGLGAIWDTLAMHAGWVTYASPGPVGGFAPAWILALWVLFATTLREPLRWMHARPLLAAAFGALGAPLSYAAAANMGACRFADPVVSLVALGIGWAVMTPVLVELARRLDNPKRVRT
jgi:hypothetical protein